MGRRPGIRASALGVDGAAVSAVARRGRVLFVGQSYYHAWYLSRELRKLGWRADVLNWDSNPAHTCTTTARTTGWAARGRRRPAHLPFYRWALQNYDIFHFSNTHGMGFGATLHHWVAERYSAGAEIRLLKRLGKKIVYSNNGCLDGVSQSSFASWGDVPVCVDCPWREGPEICSDERNLAWGKFRNGIADFQVLIGGNRIDFNDDPPVHEVPEFYCLDPERWRPDLEIPADFRLTSRGHGEDLPRGRELRERSEAGTNRNIKSTHIYVPLIEQLKREGPDVELIYFEACPTSSCATTRPRPTSWSTCSPMAGSAPTSARR